MSEDMVIAQCSPTMAGLKTGSLFACPVEDRAELAGSMRRLNATLVPRGLRMVPVKYTENKALIYMYRPDRLQQEEYLLKRGIRWTIQVTALQSLLADLITAVSFPMK